MFDHDYYNDIAQKFKTKILWFAKCLHVTNIMDAGLVSGAINTMDIVIVNSVRVENVVEQDVHNYGNDLYAVTIIRL